MTILTFTPRQTPVLASVLPVPGQIIFASKRFSDRHCPQDSLVDHAVHGRGTVAACQGLDRTVDFELQVSKPACDLKSDEWPDDVEADALVSVSWITVVRHQVAVSELSELQRKPLSKYQRWAG